MSITRNLITFIREKAIGDEDLRAAAMFTLDTVATAYAGSATPTGKLMIEWAKSGNMDDKRRALLMAALTHITETDDLHRASVTHPACAVIPAALTLGEKTGASAEKILRAILHGYEAMCRIGSAVGPAHYKIWHNTSTCGPFGSAMAAATLLDLDVEQTVNALGNAGTQSCGFWQFMQTGAMSKHLHAGRACESGLLAADLAAHGFTGPPEILEGEKGLFAGMCDDPNPSAVMAAPDSPWQLILSSIKPWPSCRHTHPAIDSALEIHSQLNGAAIESISIDTYQAALDVCNRPQPNSEYEAKFSLYHCVAIALLDGAATLASFDESAREKTADLRAVTTLRVTDPFASDYPVAWGSRVQVTTSSGTTLSAERKDCKGDPELALDNTEMRVKANGLMRYAGLDDTEADALCEQILSLPDCRTTTDVSRRFLRFIGLDN